MPETFDPATQEGNDLIPVGTYVAQVIEACVAQPQSGDGYYIALTWQITEGEHENRYVWQRITFLHSKAQAAKIGRKQFKDLCVATGINEQVSDVEVFKYIPCRIKVGIEKDKRGEYPDKNKVSRIWPLGQARNKRPQQPPSRRSRYRPHGDNGNSNDNCTEAGRERATARRRPGRSRSRRSLPRIPTTKFRY